MKKEKIIKEDAKETDRKGLARDEVGKDKGI